MGAKGGWQVCWMTGWLLLFGGVGVCHALDLSGFADITYRSSDPGGNGFELGQFDLFATEQVGDHINVLAEIVLESPSGTWETDVERMQIGYAFDNHHTVRAGRFHNLLGYWNLAYHHGAQLHTSIGRPFFLEFEDEGGVLPTHMVGLWWSSRLHTAAGKLNAGLMVGNGSSITADLSGGNTGELDPNNQGDSDNDKAVSAHITLKPAALEGLEVGVFGHKGMVTISDTPPGGPPVSVEKVDQLIWGAAAAYHGMHAELLAECYVWDHETQSTGADTTSNANYVQFGYTFDGRVTPYARYEYLKAKSDPYFTALGADTNGADEVMLGGLRLNLHYRSALKLEYRTTDRNTGGRVDEVAAQWSASF